jgi:plasmid maintenance system killer protein
MDKNLDFYKRLIEKLQMSSLFNQKLLINPDVLYDISLIKSQEDGGIVLSKNKWLELYEKSKSDFNLATVLFSSPSLPQFVIKEDIKNDDSIIAKGCTAVLNNVISLLSQDDFKTLLTSNKDAVQSFAINCTVENYALYTQEKINFMAKLYFDEKNEHHPYWGLLAFVDDVDFIYELIKREEMQLFNNNKIDFSHIEEIKTYVSNSYVLSEEEKDKFDISEVQIRELFNPTQKMIVDAYESIIASNNKILIGIFIVNAMSKNILPLSCQLDAMLQFVNDATKKTDLYLQRFLTQIKNEDVFKIAINLPAINRNALYDNEHCPAFIHEQRVNQICNLFEKNSNRKISAITNVRKSIMFTSLSDKTYETLLKIAPNELDLAYSLINSPYTPENILEKLERQSKKDMTNMKINAYSREENKIINFYANLKLNAIKSGLTNVNDVCNIFYNIRFGNDVPVEDFIKIIDNSDVSKYFKLFHILGKKFYNYLHLLTSLYIYCN